jgi:predicted acyl esterase
VAQAYTFDLPNVNHVLKPGHRLMVQVQSSLFPLYDRNPQTYVDNIFFARPGDYRKAVQRIVATPQQASYISLPVVLGDIALISRTGRPSPGSRPASLKPDRPTPTSR